MKIRPLQDWAVIKRTDPEERTAGGIIIPDSAKDKPSRGIVLSIGPGRYEIEKGREKEKKKKFVPTVVVPGQRIMFIHHRAEEFELDGEEITMVRERDILGTIEGVEEPASRDMHPLEKRIAQPVIIKEEVMPVPVPVKDAGAVRKSRTKAAAAKRAGSKKPSPVKKNEKKKEKASKAAKKPAKKTASAKSRPKATKETAAVKKTVPPKKGRVQKTVSKKRTGQKKTAISPAKTKVAKKPLRKTTPKKQAAGRKTQGKTAKKGKR